MQPKYTRGPMGRFSPSALMTDAEGREEKAKECYPLDASFVRLEKDLLQV